MTLKRSNGSALIVVIMVMTVMMILGTTILNIRLSQTKQAAYEDKRIQAHYLARSGAEVTLSAWKNPGVDVNKNLNPKPSGSCSPVYLNNSNQFVNVQPSNMIGKFDVIITNPDSSTTIITSKGTVENVTQTSTVTITQQISSYSIKWS